MQDWGDHPDRQTEDPTIIFFLPFFHLMTPSYSPDRFYDDDGDNMKAVK